MFKITFEAIPVTVRHEFVSVRVWVQSGVEPAINCGLIVIRHEEFLALALRPPCSEIVETGTSVAEGDLGPFLERLGGTAA